LTRLICPPSRAHAQQARSVTSGPFGPAPYSDDPLPTDAHLVNVKRSRRVAGLQPLGAVEQERRAVAAGLGGERLEQKTDVVAEWPPLENRAGEPAGAVLEHRYLAGTGPPSTAGELVHVVTRARTEQLDEGRRVGRHEMHDQGVAALGEAQRPVLLGEAHE